MFVPGRWVRLDANGKQVDEVTIDGESFVVPQAFFRALAAFFLEDGAYRDNVDACIEALPLVGP